MEKRFAPQARASVALAGLSGLYITGRLDAWSRLASPSFWWMHAHAMVGVWLVFAIMLFVLEPFVLHRRLEHAIAAGASSFHRVMLGLSFVTILGAFGGSHGLSA